jgi:alkylresorcinol/alkylpyrone synthase
MVSIAATATNFPPDYYSQEVLAVALRKYCMAMDLDFDLDTIDRFFSNVKVKGRYFALPLDTFYDMQGYASQTSITIETALNLFEGAVRKLLDQTQIDPQTISLLASVTLTIAIPPLEARLMNRIPFSPGVKRLPLFGYGCMGGAAGLSRVAEYLQGHPTEAAIMFVGELSSALWQGSLQLDLQTQVSQLPENPAIYSDIISNIVTAALFADGTAAILVVGEDHPLAQPGRPRVIDTRSMLLPNTGHLMGMDIVDTGFRNILRPQVTEYLRDGLRKLIDPLLADHNLTIDQIDRWIVHPGGPKVLDTVAEEFGLDPQQLHLSWDALAEVGNISSATVIYMLNQLFASGDQPPPGTYGLMIGMGPGFSQEAILLQW